MASSNFAHASHEDKPLVPDTYELENHSENISNAEGSNAPLLVQGDPSGDAIPGRFADLKSDEHTGVGFADGFFTNNTLNEHKRKRRKRQFTIILGSAAVIILLILGILLWRSQSPATTVQPATVSHSGPPRMHQAQNMQGNQKAFIAASYKSQPHQWMNQISEDWDVYRYLTDVHDANSDNRKMPPSSDRLKGIPIVQGYGGREAMAYLTFITDQWDNLPPFMIFMHGHDMGWHQPEHAITKLRALNLAALEEQGWISIRCSTHVTCAESNTGVNLTKGPSASIHGQHDGAFEATRALAAWWMWLFGEEEDVHESIDMPTGYNGQHGGQFAVTAEHVKKRPLGFYQRLLGTMTAPRARLDRTLRKVYKDVWNMTKTDREHMFAPMNEYMIGILFEKTWHKIFGKPNRFCPDEDLCRDKWYFGAIHCVPLHPEAHGFSSFQQGNCEINHRAMRKAIRMNAKYIQPQD